ncbi:hypothetical protein JCM5296_003559 [Sporobolomyces johnsonii]
MEQDLIDIDQAFGIQLSDTAEQWGAGAVGVSTLPHPKSSDEEWQDWLAERKERVRAFQEEEDRKEGMFKARMQGQGEEQPRREPEQAGPARQASPLEEIQREMQELRTQNESLARELEYVRSSPVPPPNRQVQDVVDLVGDDDDDEEWASLDAKVRTEKPKAWVGEFDHVARETWIASAVYYLARVGVELSDHIDKYRTRTPLVFYHLRSLFSSEKQPGKTAALTWFDLQDKEQGFKTAGEVFEAMRQHWVDDYSAEWALVKYRAAKQGVMKARDFASELSSLANAAFGFEISSADRKATYIAGLNSQGAFVRGCGQDRGEDGRPRGVPQAVLVYTGACFLSLFVFG